MKNRTLFFSRLALVCVALGGCGYIKSYQAKSAYGEYQQALAAGDMVHARYALTRLVHIDQDVAAYWIELGKLQLQMKDYREAYDAFSHAHELDRSNVEVLSTMAQMALLSGDVATASEHADSIALFAPESPIVKLVRGYAALKYGELDKASQLADAVLANSPNDPFAKILKSRVLIADNRIDEAIALLEEQHRVVPQDRSAIAGLSDLYRLRGDWRNVARIQSDALRLDPADTKASLLGVEAFLRAGDVQGAAQMSAPLLAPTVNQEVADNCLDLWARYAPAGRALPNGTKLATAVSGARRASFGDYYNRIGKPAVAAALLGSSQLPVTHTNAKWNAVLAESLALQGNAATAKRLFDLVLQREPDQVEALRGRSALEAKNGSRQAVLDAQRLVTVAPSSGEARLVLARAYFATGKRDEVRRTLWQAFRDLPDDERVFSALRSVLVSTGDMDGQRRLNDEFSDRRKGKLMKDLI